MEMKKAADKMSLMMGAAMSITLSLVGMLSSGSFSLSGYLINVAVSFCISFVLGKIIPIRQITDNAVRKMNLKPGTIGARLFETLVSDLSYTPIMTFIMVFIGYKQATAHGARIPFGPMLLKSEIISLIAAFVMIYFVSPILMKIAFKDIQKPE